MMNRNIYPDVKSYPVDSNPRSSGITIIIIIKNDINMEHLYFSRLNFSIHLESV